MTLGDYTRRRARHDGPMAASTEPEGTCYLHFDGMAWPDPTDPNEVQYRLRYGPTSRSDALVAASVMAAYRELVEMPQRTRNQRVAGIRAAMKARPQAPRTEGPINQKRFPGERGG